MTAVSASSRHIVSDPEALARFALLVQRFETDDRAEFLRLVKRLVGPGLALRVLDLLHRCSTAPFSPRLWDAASVDPVVSRLAAALLAA